MPYHEISIETPSAQQRRKLINGHPVRVKVGHGVTLHVSPEQHKKMMKSHSLGKAHTLTMDPYQAEQHGCGLMGDLAKASVRYVKGIAKANIPQAERFVRKEIQKHGMAGKKIAEEKLVSLGVSPGLSHMIAEESTGHLVRGAEHLAHRGFHHAGNMLGEGVKKRQGGKLPSLKSVGKKISQGFKSFAKDAKPIAQEVWKVSKPIVKSVARPLLHQAIDYGVPLAMEGLATYTGQPELLAASPFVQSQANKGVDALGSKYGFGVGGKKGKKRFGAALFPA